MKIKTIYLGIMVALILAACQSNSQKSGKDEQSEGQETEMIQLFNGNDLSNWSFFLRDPSVDPAGVFYVEDGVIHITGNPFGYMRTNDSYSDYKLHLEWRYPVEATNSGVFIHVQQPDTIWPQCYESQLKAGSAGDLICMNGSDMNERTDKSTIVVPKQAESSEKATGEWNTMEIECRDNTINVTVNGVLQNKATGTSLSEGHICLQSEGKDIEFKNIYLTMLDNQTGMTNE
jgi:hypothetical protein